MPDDVYEDADYYRKREEAERELARKAVTDDVRLVHLELATRYSELANVAHRIMSGFQSKDSVS